MDPHRNWMDCQRYGYPRYRDQQREVIIRALLGPYINHTVFNMDTVPL